MTTAIVTFYRYFELAQPRDLMAKAKAFTAEHDLTGSMSFSPQGINATMAGARPALEAYLAQLEAWMGEPLENCKWSEYVGQPFRKCRLYYKDELLGLRADGTDPRAKVGTYVPPAEWNALISQEDVKLVDVRNWYETYVGSFEGAIDPKTDTFADFARFVEEELDPGRDKRVAMFCTGGIRCEVATSYLLEKGFGEVFHLEGGILKYFEDVPTNDSMWNGECFVFDERVSVDQEMQPGGFERCRGCSCVLSAEDRAHPEYEEGVKCAGCYTRPADRIEGARERMRQMRLAEARA